MDEENKTEETPILRDAPEGTSDEQGFKADAEKARHLIDGGDVVMMMAVEGKGVIPVPVTVIFQQLFGLLNHIDQRLINLEDKLKVDPEGESRILTLN